MVSNQTKSSGEAISLHQIVNLSKSVVHRLRLKLGQPTIRGEELSVRISTSANSKYVVAVQEIHHLHTITWFAKMCGEVNA